MIHIYVFVFDTIETETHFCQIVPLTWERCTGSCWDARLQCRQPSWDPCGSSWAAFWCAICLSHLNMSRWPFLPSGIDNITYLFLITVWRNYKSWARSPHNPLFLLHTKHCFGTLTNLLIFIKTYLNDLIRVLVPTFLWIISISKNMPICRIF